MTCIIVKQVYSEWYHIVNDEKINNVCVLRKRIEVREKGAIYVIFLILVIYISSSIICVFIKLVNENNF